MDVMQFNKMRYTFLTQHIDLSLTLLGEKLAHRGVGLRVHDIDIAVFGYGLWNLEIYDASRSACASSYDIDTYDFDIFLL